MPLPDLCEEERGSCRASRARPWVELRGEGAWPAQPHLGSHETRTGQVTRGLHSRGAGSMMVCNWALGGCEGENRWPRAEQAEALPRKPGSVEARAAPGKLCPAERLRWEDTAARQSQFRPGVPSGLAVVRLGRLVPWD